MGDGVPCYGALEIVGLLLLLLLIKNVKMLKYNRPRPHLFIYPKFIYIFTKYTVNYTKKHNHYQLKHKTVKVEYT